MNKMTSKIQSRLQYGQFANLIDIECIRMMTLAPFTKIVNTRGIVTSDGFVEAEQRCLVNCIMFHMGKSRVQVFRNGKYRIMDPIPGILDKVCVKLNIR